MLTPSGLLNTPFAELADALALGFGLDCVLADCGSDCRVAVLDASRLMCFDLGYTFDILMIS